MSPSDVPFPVLGVLALAVLAVFDISFPQPGDEIFETAGSRVRIRGGTLRLRPFFQDILVAELLCLLLVWFGVFEVSQAGDHLAAALGIRPPPLGGISLSRCAGHSLVGVSLLALGASGLFRAALTISLTFDEAGLHLDHLLLGLLPYQRTTYPRAELENFFVRRSPRGERPIQLVAVRSEGLPPVRILSLVPSVSRAAALDREMRHLRTRLRELLGVDRDDPADVPSGDTIAAVPGARPSWPPPTRPREAPPAFPAGHAREPERPPPCLALRSDRRAGRRRQRNRRRRGLPRRRGRR